MGELRMPSLGADMEAGTLVEWSVAAGAHVKRGDVVALVETQKGIIEIEIWETGVIDKLLVPVGQQVPVGTLLATVASDGEKSVPSAASPVPAAAPSVPVPAPPVPSPASPVPAPASPVPAHAPPVPPAAPPVPIAPAPAHVRASPAARARAREMGVDLAAVHGTGPHGAVTRTDVEHAAAPAPAPAPVAKTPPPKRTPALEPTAMRDAIAAAMSRSKREIPHYYLSHDIDVSAALRWLEVENARRSVADRVLFAALLLKATALALHDVPELNGFWRDGAFVPSAAIHVGVAVSLRTGGLVAPAIHDVDRLALGDLMKALGDLVGRVRAGTIRASEMADPTVTVTNLGEQGTDAVFGVIYPPQVAIVGFGAPRERPWADGGMLGVRPIVTASLAADHRASDGHRGARFLAKVARLLTTPEKL